MNNNLFTLTRICQAIKFLNNNNNNKPIGLAIIIFFSNAIMNIRIELKLELKEEANKNILS